MNVVPGKEYSHCSSAPTRCIEYSSRYRVQANAGQDRLEVEPCDIPENQQLLWAPGHAWTCLCPDCPPSAHITSAGGQIPMHWQQMHFSGLDSHDVLRESSMESGGPGSCTSAITTISSDASSSCLEDTTLVPNVSEHADRPSPVDKY